MQNARPGRQVVLTAVNLDISVETVESQSFLITHWVVDLKVRSPRAIQI